ncbi:unnamed protein product [Mucor circinelloides]
MLRLDTFSQDLRTQDHAVIFCAKMGLLYDANYQGITCLNGMVMKLRYDWQRGYYWRCTRNNCCGKSRASVLEHSFFAQRRSSLSKQLLVLYFWVNRAPRSFISSVVGLHSSTVKNIIDDFYQVMQEDIAEGLSRGDENALKIGGPGIIVEIDESKFGKRKYNTGHRVEGVWVIGGVERTPERRVFLVAVENRNAETIKALILRYVAPGSIIHTDCWAAYVNIPNWRNAPSDLPFTHERVNHSVEYVNENGAHTNTIEGTWNGIKLRIFPHQRTKKKTFLGCFLSLCGEESTTLTSGVDY